MSSVNLFALPFCRPSSLATGNAVNVICFQSYELSVPGKETKLLLLLALAKLSVSNTEHYRISPALIPPIILSNYHTGGSPMNLSFVAQPKALQ